MTGRKRALAVLAAGALFTPLISMGAVASAAPGDTDPPPPRSIAELCAEVSEDFNPFDDIEGNQLENEIICLAAAEITRGSANPDLYEPGASVNRDQMASFIARLIDTANELETEGTELQDLPPSDGVVPFTDVATNNVHRDAIDRLEQAGIVEGGPGGRPMTEYGPALDVSRAQMASFIKRALEFLVDGETFSSDSDFFTDDENATPHEPNINAIAELAIAVGPGGNIYNPFQSVSRAQMAAFLTRTLAVLEERDAITPIDADGGTTPPGPDVTVDDQSVAPGEDIMFTVEADNIASVAVSGECVESETFTEDADADAEGFQVVIPVSEDAEPGVCTINLVITDTEGQEFEASFDVTIEGATGGFPDQAAVTDAPELLRIEVAREADSDDVNIRFVFDEQITGKTPTAGCFHLFKFGHEPFGGDEADDANTCPGHSGDGTRNIDESSIDGDAAVIDREDPNSVVVNFDVGESEFANVTLATVDWDAVRDDAGIMNTEGDAPVQNVDLAEGTTSAPDLVSIGDFDADTHTVDFVFDEDVERATPLAASNFLLIDDDGDVRRGDAVLDEQDDDDNDRTVEVRFSDTDPDGDGTDGPVDPAAPGTDDEGTSGDIQPDTEEETARAVVLSGTVSDDEGDTNPLQAVNGAGSPGTEDDESTGGNTDEPDLVTVEFNVEDNTATFDFDEAVTLDGDGAFFQVYDSNGDETEGDDANRSETDNTQVTVTFGDGVLEEAVGASVDEDAVFAVSGAANEGNEADEAAVQGRSFEGGLTSGPDLTGARVELSGDLENELVVVYVFDEDVQDTADPARFFVYDEEGNPTRGATAVQNEDNENEIEVTFADNDDTIEDSLAATVNNDAVVDGDGDTDGAGTDTDTDGEDDGNPEGYEVLEQRDSSTS